MPAWELFAAVSLAAVAAMLVLAWASRDVLARGALADTRRGDDGHPKFGPFALLANVAFTHGLLGAVLVGTAWFTRVPPRSIGIGPEPTGTLVLGVALGVGLSLVNETAAVLARRVGVGYDERLRELLAPTSGVGWVLLLGGALPVIAGVEELLFRGALIGALSAGFGVSVWALAIGSSVLFGLGHGLQGPGGVLVTGMLGLILAVAFVLTGSLLVVAIAHYVVNVLELVGHAAYGDRDRQSG